MRLEVADAGDHLADQWSTLIVPALQLQPRLHPRPRRTRVVTIWRFQVRDRQFAEASIESTSAKLFKRCQGTAPLISTMAGESQPISEPEIYIGREAVCPDRPDCPKRTGGSITHRRRRNHLSRHPASSPPSPRAGKQAGTARHDRTWQISAVFASLSPPSQPSPAQVTPGILSASPILAARCRSLEQSEGSLP